MNKKTLIVVIILTIVMTIMEMIGIPAALFVNINFKDINPIYFILIINFIFAFILCFICKKTILKDWNFGLNKKGILSGLKKYGLIGVVGTIVITISFIVGLSSFDNKPTIYRLLIECVVYYIGVGIMEELYLRGLLQNLLEKWFNKIKNGTVLAIIIASFLFGIGHIFGSLGLPITTIICKVIWTIALGIYLGSIYVLTRNLWVSIIMHFMINFFVSIVYCFTTSTNYPNIALITNVLIFSILAVYGIKNVLKIKK